MNSPIKVLKDEQFGNPISEKLSNLLRCYTTNNDRANVSISTGVGSSTVRDVSYRNNNLTEDNSKAIIALVEIAIKNCRESISNAQKALKYLSSIVEEK